MQLVYFLLLPSALLSVPLYEWASASPAHQAHNLSPLSTCMAFLNVWFVVGCFAVSSRWLEKARDTLSHASQNPKSAYTHARSIPWWLRNRHSMLVWIWCITQPVCLVAAGWTPWTVNMLGSDPDRAAQVALIVAPSALLLTLVELMGCSRLRQHRVGKESFVNHWLGSIRLTWHHATNSWLVPIALPVLVAVMADLCQLAGNGLPNFGKLGTIVGVIVSSLLTTLLFPHLFVKLIGAKPVDESVDKIAMQAWRTSNVRAPRILQWPTGCRAANAAVIGMFAYGRKLLLTDGLVQNLNERELSMVVLHELAHCMRWHSWIRVLPTALTIALLLGSMSLFHGIWLSTACLILLVLFVVSLVSICWWTEYDADQTAIRLAMRLYEPMTTADSNEALVRDEHVLNLTNALRKIYGSRNFSKSSWLHPSCNHRIAALARKNVMRSVATV